MSRNAIAAVAVIVSLLCNSTAHADSASAFMALVRRPPVYQFVLATDAGTYECESILLAYRSKLAMQKMGGPSADGNYAEIVGCVAAQKDLPRETLLSAIKYLSDKPSSAKALKDFYLKWTTKLESMVPNSGETTTAHSSRIAAATGAMKESQKALELELELGL